MNYIPKTHIDRCMYADQKYLLGNAAEYEHISHITYIKFSSLYILPHLLLIKFLLLIFLCDILYFQKLTTKFFGYCLKIYDQISKLELTVSCF